MKLEFLLRLKDLFSRPRPPLADPVSLSKLEHIIRYSFQNRSLLVRALVHRSYASHDGEEAKADSSNERMEFLGDAVLSLVVNHFLYETYPEKREGELTKMKSVIVSKSILSHYAKRHGIGDG